MTGVDTRTLTRWLRERGTRPGLLFPPTMPLDEARANAGCVDMRREVYYRVAPSERITYGNGDLTILLIDVGCWVYEVR